MPCQNEILLLTIACLVGYIFLLFFNEKRAARWVIWYYKMDKKEQKKYNPMMVIKRARIIVISAGLVSLIGFALSFYYRYSKIIAFIIAETIFGIGALFLGPKACKKK